MTTATNDDGDGRDQRLDPPRFHFTNNWTQLPTWEYGDYRWLYCSGGYRIPGERNYPIGVFYIAQYFLYLAIYAPALVVIARPPLIQHSCYKLMLAIGVLDNVFGLVFSTFMAGVLSLMGANYCDNTRLLIYVAHVGHGLWFALCMAGVLLAFNRLVDMKWPRLGDRLFAGGRTWLWLLGPVAYGVLAASSIDLPPIYNSVWSVYLFHRQLLDFRFYKDFL